MKRELARAAIGVGVFLVLLAGVVLVGLRSRAPAGQQSGNGASAAAAEERSGFGEAGPFLGEQVIPPRLAPAFDLTDRSETRVQLQDFQGKWVLLSFAYTSCPDVCPIMFSHFLTVQEKLADHLENDLVLAFITVDPEADTPERLDKHVRSVGGKWHFLTGPLATMQEVWKGFRVRVEKEGVFVAHTSITYLIDRNGLIRVRFLGVPPAKVLIEDIEKVLE